MEPDCAEIIVEFSVRKFIGRVGGRSTSSGIPVASGSNEFEFAATISAVTAVGYSEK